MLKELQLTNFKSFAGEPQTIPFAPVTLFVGANGSGKSNALDALRFLQGLGLDLTIPQILDGKSEGGNVVHTGIRGRAAEVAWNGAQSFSLKTTIEANNDHLRNRAQRMTSGNGRRRRAGVVFQPKSRCLEHFVECRVDSHPSLTAESLHSDQEGMLFGADDAELQFLANVPTEGVASSSLDSFSLDRSLLGQFRDFDEVHELVEQWSTALRRRYAGIRFQSIAPSQVKDYVPAAADELGSEGQNLSAVLYRVCRDDGSREKLIGWLSELCAPSVVGIDFDETKLGDVLVQLVEEGGRRISARSLSDGTLRFLGILAAMIAAPGRSLFVFEEIENGLHPSRIHLLLELLEQFAEANAHQIIATTHNPQALQALSEDALRNAVLFARTEGDPGTVVRRLGEIEHYDEVSQKTGVDELFSTGWLEFAL